MNTRATVHFCYAGQTQAIVYRHSDGYKEGLGKDLKSFLDEAAKLPDPRFNDPRYLATKWVVWDAAQHTTPAGSLDFLGVGIVMEDPGDIEFRYVLHCDGGRPKVIIKKV